MTRLACFTHKSAIIPLAVFIGIASADFWASAQDTEPEYRPRRLIRDPIRPITNPKIVAAAESDLQDNELVIGVVVNNEARAYPINQLTGPQREIINDKLGNTAIAATW